MPRGKSQSHGGEGPRHNPTDASSGHAWSRAAPPASSVRQIPSGPVWRAILKTRHPTTPHDPPPKSITATRNCLHPMTPPTFWRSVLSYVRRNSGSAVSTTMGLNTPYGARCSLTSTPKLGGKFTCINAPFGDQCFLTG